MNIEETSKILAMIALVENRKFTDEQIGAWQLLLKDIEFMHANEAVVRYYRMHTESVKPANIYRLAKEVKVELSKKQYGNPNL